MLAKGYDVHGIVRRVAFEDPEHRMWRIQHILNDIQIHAASLESYASIFRVFQKVQPDEYYHTLDELIEEMAEHDLQAEAE